MTKELAITRQVSPLIAKAQQLSIKSSKDMTTASIMRVTLKKMANTIKTEKDKVMRPLLDAVAAERARWAPAEKNIDEALKYVDRSMIAYQTDAKRKADEDAAKIAARIGHGRGKLTMETALQKLENVDTPDAVVHTNDGATAFRTYEMFEVDDIDKLPSYYLLPNETLIRKAMEQGLKLPGVRYYTEERPINRHA